MRTEIWLRIMNKLTLAWSAALLLTVLLLLEEFLKPFRWLLVISSLGVPYGKAIATEQLFFLLGED
jgi:hypothetical protein